MIWPDGVDPRRLRQPDRRSCGAATVVAARIVHDADYRPPDPADTIDRTHRQLTSVAGSGGPGGDGRVRLPWPRERGTPPWAIARELAALTGDRVRTHVARWRPVTSYDVLRGRVAQRPTAVYVGSAWIPRHVVLAVTDTGAGIEVFDPARGRLVVVPEQRWVAHAVGLAGWSHVWAIV